MGGIQAAGPMGGEHVGNWGKMGTERGILGHRKLDTGPENIERQREGDKGGGTQRQSPRGQDSNRKRQNERKTEGRKGERENREASELMLPLCTISFFG